MQDELNDLAWFRKGLRSFVTFRIARVQNRLNAQATALLRSNTNLSLTEWRIISIINLLGPTTASTISREVYMDKGQISRAVKQMVSNGLLESKVNLQDNRQSMLHLTDKGRKVLDDNVQTMRSRNEKLTENISDEDLEVFFRVLEQIRENTDTTGGV